MLPRPAPSFPARYSTSTAVREFVVSQWQLIVLACFVVVAALARIVDVTEVPKGFFTDEASFGLNADLILHTGRDEYGKFLPVLFRSFGEYKLPVFIYLEVPFMAIFGRSEEAVRLTSAVAGTLTVVTTYLLAKELFKRDLVGLASAGFLAISPWHIHYSRTGLGDIVVLPLFFTLGFYLFFRAMRDYRFLIPSAVVLALVFYCYRGGWLVMPPLLLFAAIAYRKELWAMREMTAVAAVTFLVILAPLAYHLLFANSDRSSQAWIFNINDPNRGTLEIFSDFYRSYYTRSFLFENGDNGAIVRHYLPGQGWLYYIQAPLLLAGIAAMLVKRTRGGFFVLLLLVAYPLTASVSDTSPISSRAILGSLAMALTTGIGVWAVVSAVGKLTAGRYEAVAIAATLAVIAAISLHSFWNYENKYFDNYARVSDGYWGWQDGPQEIVAYFLTVEDDYDQLIMSGDFNAPGIFFPFYAGDVRCKKCFIGGPNSYKPERHQLFALKPEVLDASGRPYRTIDTIKYKNGSIAFRLVEFSTAGLQPDGGAR